uniref:Uncharacterized protein n=1 Tax=Arundo donax TaxID=35708 RepID=A0A0A9GTT6_ARUDO
MHDFHTRTSSVPVGFALLVWTSCNTILGT